MIMKQIHLVNVRFRIRVDAIPLVSLFQPPAPTEGIISQNSSSEFNLEGSSFPVVSWVRNLD